jgi:prepilin-type N-terminal cleavage/methylation domain-containing protein
MSGRARGGFTLLEVLVATAIMAIATTTLLTALTTSLRNASRITDTDRAELLARQKMDELLATPYLPLNSEIDGGWDPSMTGGVEAGWRAMTTVFEAPPGAPPSMRVLERVELEVWWKNGDNRQSFKLGGYKISRPAPGPQP